MVNVLSVNKGTTPLTSKIVFFAFTKNTWILKRYFIVKFTKTMDFLLVVCVRNARTIIDLILVKMAV